MFAQYTIFIDDREQAQATLKENGIPTAVHYPVPMHLQPAYQDLCCPECCPESVKAAGRVMSLPIYPDMNASTQLMVVNALS